MEEKKHWIFRWMCRCIIVNIIINGVGVLTGFITKEMIIPIWNIEKRQGRVTIQELVEEIKRNIGKEYHMGQR